MEKYVCWTDIHEEVYCLTVQLIYQNYLVTILASCK